MDNQNPDPSQSSSGTVPPGAPSNPEAAGNPPPGVTQDWRTQRRAERWARREARGQMRAGRNTGWIAGVFLILLGVIFLLQQMSLPFLTNWWALLILIPAFWAYVAAWDSYQDGKRLTRRAAASLTVGILLTILALLFLLNVYSSFVWPALLIVGGLALVGSALVPE
jgi:hypothetical protein